MSNKGKNKRTCENGHTFYKTSDCPVCPVCEAEAKPKTGFMSELSAPARRALEHEGVTSLQKLSEYKEKEILRLHGMGPASMPTLKKFLGSEGLSFKK